jgi:hypothetical protein
MPDKLATINGAMTNKVGERYGVSSGNGQGKTIGEDGERRRRAKATGTSGDMVTVNKEGLKEADDAEDAVDFEGDGGDYG